MQVYTTDMALDMDTVTAKATVQGHHTSPQFWYTRRAAIIGIAILFVAVEWISVLVPPLQSPDETAHLARAYMVSKGDILPKTLNGETGGDLDTGLLVYLDSFQSLWFHYDRKVTTADIRSTRKLHWTGRRQFRGIPNTAVYFPLPYLPQVMALIVGEQANLSIDTTYYLARLLSLIATLDLLLMAALLYPIPLFVVALFITPMTLFQLGSTSLDAMTFGTCALTSALFLRGADRKYRFDSRMHAGLALCAFSLATSRIVMIPLTLLPAVLASHRKSRGYIVSSALSFMLSIAWITYNTVTVKGLSGQGGDPSTTTVHYLQHPGAFLDLVFHTFGNPDILWSYWALFVGVLGCLDTPLNPFVYVIFAVVLIALAALSIPHAPSQWVNLNSLSLLFAAALSTVFMLVIEIIIVTPVSAAQIYGIHGRYFTPTLILTGYAIFHRVHSSDTRKLSVAIIVVGAALSITDVMPRLLDRYWLS